MLQGALGLGGAMAVTQIFGESVMQTSHAGTPGGNVLVVLSLRGGIDGLGGVIIGRALYEGRVDLAEALAAAAKLG